MKYFEKYLSDGNASSEIDISVHCDIKIFEWLMKYLRHTEKLKKQKYKGFVAKHNQYKKKSDEERKKEKELEILHPSDLQPVLDLKNVISILISSDFLKMKELVEECVCYVISNLHDVVRLPIDMKCLNTSLIRQICD